MVKRRTHSLIDNFPAALRDSLTRMLVDNEWPADFPGEHAGTPRHEDCVLYCTTQGYSISMSSIGRYANRMKLLARMKQAGVIVRDVMKDDEQEKTSEIQKAVGKMLTAVIIDFVSSQENMTAKEIMDVSRAIRDCTQVSISADKYIREQLKEKVEQTAKSMKDRLIKGGVDKKLIQKTIDEHLRILKP